MLKGHKDSVEVHETLAASVIQKDSNSVFAAQSIKGIIEYKYDQHYPLLISTLFMRIIYAFFIYFGDSYNARNPNILVLFTIYHTILLILTSTPWRPRSFLVWLYFMWPVCCELQTVITSIIYLV